MKFEQYKPLPEEIQKAEEMMTEEQKIASQEREKNWPPKKMWGISFSGRGKDKKPIPLSECLEIVRNINSIDKKALKELQIDLRHRNIDEVEELMQEFEKEFPDIKISFHGNTPQVGGENFTIINKENLFKEASIVAKLGCEVFTIHPPELDWQTIERLGEQDIHNLIRNYSDFLAEMIYKGSYQNKNFKVGIENVPIKDKNGKNVSIEVMKMIIQTVALTLEKKYNLSKEEAEDKIGITLDVSNTYALEGEAHREEMLRSWLSQTNNKIFCFHFYAPSEFSPDFQNKVQRFEALIKEYNVIAPIYLESKQPPLTTKELYERATSLKT